MENLVFIVLVVLLVALALNHYGLLQPRTVAQFPDDGDEGIDRRLLQAVRGNRALAHRLMRQVRLKYPDKNERWHIEKVLYDLERDGGYVTPRSPAPSVRLNLNRSKRRDMLEDLFFISTVLWFLRVISSYVSDLFRRY